MHSGLALRLRAGLEAVAMLFASITSRSSILDKRESRRLLSCLSTSRCALIGSC